MERAWWLTLSTGVFAVVAAAVLGDVAQSAVRAGSAIVLVAVVAVQLRRRPEITRAPWALLATGGVLALVSAITRLTHGIIINEPNPFPSPAEAPGYLGYVFVIAAARSFWKHRSLGRDIAAALDGLLIAAAAAVVVFSAILSEYLRDSEVNIFARLGNVGYSVLTLTLLGFVARLAVGPGARNTAWRLIAGATSAILTNDLLLLLDTTGSGWAFTAASITSPLAFFFATAAILHPEAHALTDAPSYTAARLSVGRIAMLGAALLTLPAALLSSLVRGTAPDLPVLVGGSAALAVLSLARISLLFRANERTVGLEVALSESGRELLDASTASDVALAVSSTIRLVAGAEVRFAAIVQGTGGARHLIQRSIRGGEIEFETLAPEAEAGPWSGLEGRSQMARIVHLELGEDAEFGEILVEVPPSPDAAYSLALQTMSAQITQALTSLSLAETRFNQRAERRLTALVEQSTDLVTVIDQNNEVTFVSPNAARLLDVAPGAMADSHPSSLVHIADAGELKRLVEQPTKPHESSHATELRLRAASGEYRWFDATARDFTDDPEVAGIVVTARDVNDERAAKLGLKRSEQWFRGLVQHSSDVIAVLDEAGIFTYASPAAEDLFGLRPEMLRGRSFLELLPTDDLESLGRARRSIHSKPPGVRNLELVLERPDQTLRTTEVTITDLRDDPSVSGLVLNIRDVTERKKLEEDLRHQVLHDDLTGLGSRVQFTNQLGEALGPKRSPGSKVAALFIDLDAFKNINDSLGHAAGDQVLVEISSRLLGGLRLQDRAARFGGDEFAVLLTDIYGISDVTGIADRIVEELSRPVTLMGKEVQLGVSVGIAIDDGHSQSPEDLLRSADVAMYEAKAQGKGRWAIFESSMADQTIERFEIANTLGAAIDNDELMVYYQPIVDLATGRTIGVEALVRWNHPVRGMVSPAAFIPIAERNGLIVPLGRFVLEEATHQVAAWRSQGHDIYASINISPVQLVRNGIVAEILEVVDRAGLERSAVVLELTESALIADFELVVGRIDALRQAGLRVAIDDFGTGNATLKYAEEFSADILKIDQSFVSRLETHDESTIISTVLSIAKSMGASAIAEGIEVPDQHRRLLALGCLFGQGYYFTRPAPAEVIELTLSRELEGEALTGHGH